MKTFLIVKNDNDPNSFCDSQFKVDDQTKIQEILKKSGFNCNIKNYTFFDESEKYSDIKQIYFKKYLDSIVEQYFPSTYDIKKTTYVYYPKEEIIYHKDSNNKTYVHRWSEFNLDESVKTARYICDDTDDPEENQRILILHQ